MRTTESERDKIPTRMSEKLVNAHGLATRLGPRCGTVHGSRERRSLKKDLSFVGRMQRCSSVADTSMLGVPNTRVRLTALTACDLLCT